MTDAHPPRLALVSAMHEELAAVLALMQDSHCERVAGREFWLGHLHGVPVVVVLSRIGKVAAAATTTVLVERFKVSHLVFTGVAGGVGDGVRVGDLVVAQSLVQHDMDCSPLFPRHEVPLTGRSHFEVDAALQSALTQAAQAVLADPRVTLGADAVAEFGLQQARVHQGLIASGDQFVATSAASQAVRAALPGTLAVEMEGAAVAQVCHDYGLPFAAIRTISDRADDDAHTDFLRFVQVVASRYSAALVDHLLRQPRELMLGPSTS